jgi:serine phosphatase RsbU (regulator of sigma subunit)
MTRLRTRLLLAFFLLAVVPLAGVTIYGHVSTRRAFEQAVKAESQAVAEDMGRRLDGVTAELGRRLAAAGEASLPGLGAEPEAQAEEERRARVAERVRAALGGAAEFVESLELIPAPPPPPPPPGTPPGAGHASAPAGAGPHPPRRIVIRRLPGPEGGPELKVVVPAPDIGVDPETIRRTVAAGAKLIADLAELEAQRAKAVAETAQRQRVSEHAAREQARAMTRRALEHAPEALGSELKALLDREFDLPITVERDGTPLGTLRAQVSAERVLGDVLGHTRRDRREIPFALDAEGRLHAAEADRPVLQQLGLSSDMPSAPHAHGDYVVATRRDPTTGLTLGIVRPVGEGLQEIRRTAARNLAWGLGLVGLAMVGILPLSRRLTGDLARLAEGAERLGHGDLDTRVAVRSRDEVGRLAATFNRMADELRAHQERLIEQERLRKELELCRRIQDEMLPHGALRVPFAEAKGVSVPAREVGGDFFNFFALSEAETALLVGDVSGKGVPAALMMANVQATLRARLPLERDLAHLATQLDAEIDAATALTTYVTLFLAIVDGRACELRYVNAGHNPAFLLRADGRVEALPATGRPLGLLPGAGYEERRVALLAGDSLFIYTDGLVESENAAGEPFGMQRLEELLVRERASGLEGVLARVDEAVRAFRDGVEAADDATMLLLKMGVPAEA